MIILKLTQDEADRLFFYLGLQSTNSALDTFSIFEKLSAKVDDGFNPRYSIAKHFELTERTRLTDTGLFMVDSDVDTKRT